MNEVRKNKIQIQCSHNDKFFQIIYLLEGCLVKKNIRNGTAINLSAIRHTADCPVLLCSSVVSAMSCISRVRVHIGNNKLLIQKMLQIILVEYIIVFTRYNFLSSGNLFFPTGIKCAAISFVHCAH